MSYNISDCIPSNYSLVRVAGDQASWENIQSGVLISRSENKISIHFENAVSYERPVAILTEGNFSFSIELAKGAECQMVEFISGHTDSKMDILLSENSKLNLSRVQISQSIKTQLTCTQKDYSSLTVSTVSLSGDNNNTLHIFAQQSTHTRLLGLGMSDGDEKLENIIRLYHQKAHGESFQTFRYIASGDSTATFDGKIIVEPNAQKIQAYQKNNNILLSPSATVHSDPQLEIYADDVKCSHGSTVGQLDETAMFYMQSRGIPYPIAKAMLIRSFAAQTLEAIPQQWIVEKIEDFVEKKLR